MPTLSISSQQTYGERRVTQLLSQLSKDYFAVSEPLINSRAGSKLPDFVVVARYLGVAVIEVKDWKDIREASQKEFKVRRYDGTLQTYANPTRTARDYALDLTRQFEKNQSLLVEHNGRTKLSFPWQEVVVLPNISQALVEDLETRGIIPERMVLGREKLESVEVFEDALLNLPWRFRMKAPLGQSVLDGIRGVIDPEIIITTPKGSIGGYETVHQAKLIRETPPPVSEILSENAAIPDDVLSLTSDLNVKLIRGVAGAGKTLVLVRRTLFLKTHFPQYRVLVMTFNKDLAADLEKRIASPGIKVTNFHKICREVIGSKWQSPVESHDWLRGQEAAFIRKNDMTVDFVAEEIKWRKDTDLFDNADYLAAERKGRGAKLLPNRREIINQVFDRYRKAQTGPVPDRRAFIDWEDVPHLAYAALQHEDSHFRESYDVIMLDEAQDFAPSWIKVIKLLLKPSGSMLVCDDPTQSIFKNFSWKEKGLNVVGKTAILRIPFRSTRQIMEAAFSLVESDPVLSTSDEMTEPRLNIGELRSGDKPTLLQASSWEDEQSQVEKAVRDLLNKDVPPEKIAILCHNKKGISSFAHLGVHAKVVRQLVVKPVATG